MVKTHQQPLGFRILVYGGIFIAAVFFYGTIIVTSMLPTEPSLYLMPLTLVPFTLFFVCAYAVPIEVSVSDESLILRTPCLTRRIPWMNVRETIFQNVIGGNGTLDFSHPSFIIIKTTHRYYRYYFVPRYICGYEDLVTIFQKNAKFRII